MAADFARDVRAFILENFLLGRESGFRDDTSFLEEGIVDSTGILELVSHLEERYEIEITEDELIPENLDSVERIAQYLSRKLPALEACKSILQPTLAAQPA